MSLHCLLRLLHLFHFSSDPSSGCPGLFLLPTIVPLMTSHCTLSQFDLLPPFIPLGIFTPSDIVHESHCIRVRAVQYEGILFFFFLSHEAAHSSMCWFGSSHITTILNFGVGLEILPHSSYSPYICVHILCVLVAHHHAHVVRCQCELSRSSKRYCKFSLTSAEIFLFPPRSFFQKSLNMSISQSPGGFCRVNQWLFVLRRSSG